MIWFLTNADTEILALRSVVDDLPEGFPSVRAANPNTLPGPLPLDRVRLVLIRLLGGRRAWQEGFDDLRNRCAQAGIAFLAVGGEAGIDGELTKLSSVHTAVVTDAMRYLVNGGPANLAQLLRYLADTVLIEGFGFDAPIEIEHFGVWSGAGIGMPTYERSDRPLVAVLFYRAQLIAGNTQFVLDMCNALDEVGCDALAIWCYSLRPGPDMRIPAIELCAEHNVDAVITSMLATGGMAAGAGIPGATGGLEGDAWDVSVLNRLGVAIIQAPMSSTSSEAWEASDAGLSPIDVAMGVAIPEFDGRIIAPPIAFKEVVDDGDQLGSFVHAHRSLPDRTRRIAGIAARHARLRKLKNADRRVAIVLSAYPTKRSRLGNAVGLDTPASVITILHAMSSAGYNVSNIPSDGDTLMATLADGLTYDAEHLNASQLDEAVGNLPTHTYDDWFATLPLNAQDEVRQAWGPSPGTARVHNDSLVFSGVSFGNVIVAIQPPRGYGDDPIAVYHSPTLAPAHHYLAFYRWLDSVWGADAIVHAGKHGTLEWLPGKGVGLSSSCFPDAALGDVPLFYPFIVNDPGEGTQAKRRGHGVVIDHLVPPLTRADTYDDLAKLEQLFDEYAQLQSLDPTKLAMVRRQIWDLLEASSLNRDLGIDEAPPEEEFDDLLLHVDGYLCELKDAQIRGGLHILGVAPSGEAEVDLVSAITRLPNGSIPSLRGEVAARLGVNDKLEERHALDAVEAEVKHQLFAAQARGWVSDRADEPALAWASNWLVPNLHKCTDEIENLLAGLEGRYVPAGPSGALTRGGAHVLPTGRNFYSVDPKALPSALSWEVGTKLANALIARHLEEEGTYPKTVGLVLWGTAAMRTHGDDVAEALALLGVRPVWEPESRRVTGLEVIALAELQRPRIDVTLRVSGFFRDAFANLITLVDDAVALVGALDEPVDQNPVAATGIVDARVFGPAPGGYGSGILTVLENRNWQSDADLAAVYAAWGGWSYGSRGWGRHDEAAMERRFAAIDIAVKNQDNREHDIFDSDDYLQDHGGMIATIRNLTGRQPKAWFGDSSNPNAPKVRSLAEEAARVVRTRVVNPKWINAMTRHGYKGAFEMAATVDYIFGYDATAHVVEDWMYERVSDAYVADPAIRKFFEESNPWALTSIAERLLEAHARGMWNATETSLATLRSAVLEAEGWAESR